MDENKHDLELRVAELEAQVKERDARIETITRKMNRIMEYLGIEDDCQEADGIEVPEDLSCNFLNEKLTRRHLELLYKAIYGVISHNSNAEEGKISTTRKLDVFYLKCAFEYQYKNVMKEVGNRTGRSLTNFIWNHTLYNKEHHTNAPFCKMLAKWFPEVEAWQDIRKLSKGLSDEERKWDQICEKEELSSCEKEKSKLLDSCVKALTEVYNKIKLELD